MLSTVKSSQAERGGQEDDTYVLMQALLYNKDSNGNNDNTTFLGAIYKQNKIYGFCTWHD